MAVGDPTDPSGFDLGASIRNTLAVAPTLVHAPGVAVAIAQGNLSTTQTEQVGSFQRGSQLLQFMAGQAPDAQRKLFNSFSSDDQVLLTQAGYKAPKPGKRSIFGTIVHDASGVGNTLLHAAGAPLRLEQHLSRAGELDPAEYVYSPGWGSKITSDDGTGQMTNATAASIWHPSSFVRAWRATTNGSRAFDAKQLAAVQDKYGTDVFNLARQQAEGDSIQDITGGNPTTLQAAQQTAQDPSYKQALADIKAAQISPGRQFANAIGLKPGSDAYNLTSGGVDGLDDWYGDPTLSGGKLAKAGMAAKWGIRANDTTRVETLMQTPQAQRGWGYLLPRINTIKNSEDAVAKGQAIADVQRHFPNTLGLIDPLIEDASGAGRDVTMDSVTTYLSGMDGMARMATGLAAREVPTLPGRLSKLGEARISASNGVHQAIDYVTDGRRYLPYDQYATPEEAAKIATDTTGEIPSGATDIASANQEAASQAYGEAALDYRKSLSGRLRYMARRLTTRVPATSNLDVAAPNSLKLIRQTALTYLPTSRANEITGAFAAADLAGKRSIYKGLLQELGHASGMTMSQSGADYWARFMGDVDAADARETYSALGNDSGIFVRNTASGTRSLGGTAGQITNKWTLPSFKEMQQNAARIGVADRVMGGLNNSWVDNFMGKWRTGVLFRVAFPLRVAMEDLFNQFYRGNGMGVLQSRIATSRVAASVEGDPESALARSIGKVADGATAALGLPSSGAHIPISYTLSKMAHVLKVGTDVFMDPDYEKYISKLYNGTAHDRLYQGIIEDHKQLAQGAGDAMPEDVAADTKWGEIGWKPNNTFEVGTAQGMNGALRWSHNLQYGADDPVAMHVMLNPEKSFDDLAPELLTLMKSGEYEPVLHGAEIANWTKDGRSVAAGEATQDEALTDWASDIYTNFHHLIRSGDGRLIKPVTKYIAENKTTPSAQWLNQRVRDADGNFTSEAFLKDRPDTVVGPDFVPYTKSTAANLIQHGWEQIVARPMNYLSRQPIAHYEYVQARKTLEPWEAQLASKGMSAENVENIVDTRAQMIAHDRAIKFIHNPALRSQFSVIARNLFPFRHAEESALQRWSTAMLYSPEGLRRAQLTVEGLHHSGIVTKDSSGNDYVAFPGSAALVQLSAKLANLLPGVNIAELPIKANMGFELKFISPFLSQFGGIGTGNDPAEKALNDIHPLIPPSGPILGTGLALVKQFLPESRVAQDASEAFVSQEGQGKPIWEQFVPTAVSRIYGAFQNSNDANSQLASAMRNAAAYMEAAGLSPDASASPDQVDQYLNRLKSWSRNMLVMRAIMGFATPAAPTVDQFSPDSDELFAAEGIHSLTNEFYAMTSEMPYQDALTAFIKLHPDDSPFTVAQSEAPSGAQMPATVQTLNWMDSHVGLLKKYPSVAPFLMPLDSGQFNYDAYKEQLAAGIRQKKSVKDFYADLKVRTASDTYYATRNQTNTAEANLRAQGQPKVAEQLAAGFSAWSQQFQSLNPLFAQYLSEGSARQQNKLEAINQLKGMVASGDVNNLVSPDDASGISQMLGVWDEWQTTKQQLYGRSDAASTNIRKSTQAGADSYISQIAGTNPQLQGIYSTIFAPLLASN